MKKIFLLWLICLGACNFQVAPKQEISSIQDTTILAQNYCLKIDHSSLDSTYRMVLQFSANTIELQFLDNNIYSFVMNRKRRKGKITLIQEFMIRYLISKIPNENIQLLNPIEKGALFETHLKIDLLRDGKRNEFLFSNHPLPDSFEQLIEYINGLTEVREIVYNRKKIRDIGFYEVGIHGRYSFGPNIRMQIRNDSLKIHYKKYHPEESYESCYALTKKESMEIRRTLESIPFDELKYKYADHGVLDGATIAFEINLDQQVYYTRYTNYAMDVGLQKILLLITKINTDNIMQKMYPSDFWKDPILIGSCEFCDRLMKFWPFSKTTDKISPSKSEICF